MPANEDADRVKAALRHDNWLTLGQAIDGLEKARRRIRGIEGDRVALECDADVPQMLCHGFEIMVGLKHCSSDTCSGAGLNRI